jgi:PAS domain S-box-containing protein
MMNRILLLVSTPDMRHMLREWLVRDYDVLVQDSPKSLDEDFDLCVIDHGMLSQLTEDIEGRKEEEAPLFLPVLFIVSRENLQHITRTKLQQVDEFVTSPIKRTELHTRLDSLLEMRRLSARLQAQQERFLQVSKAIESTSDAISIADMHGTALYHNQAFTNLYGYTINDLNLKGIPHTLFVYPEVAAEIFATLREGNSWQGEADLRSKEGRIIPTAIQADSILDERGHQLGLVSIYTDITERRQMQAIQHEQRAMNKALRDTAAALTSTLDLDEVLDRILASIGYVVPHDTAHILLIQDGSARMVRSRGLGSGDLESRLRSRNIQVFDTTELHRMSKSGQPVIIADVDPKWALHQYLPLRDIRSYIGVPVKLSSVTMGFIYLTSRQPDFFTEAHADHLQLFAEQAAIALQNAQLHEKARELAMMEERQRLARNLHDAVSQTLFSASMIAEALPRLWNSNPEKVRPRLDQLHRLTRGALAEMRMLLLELRPTALMEADLGELLEQLVNALQGRATLDVTLHLEGDEHEFSEEVQTALFYITQEALNNIVKHAHADHVDVTLHARQHSVDLEIVDNGQGFDPAEVSATSLGLNIMHERAQAIGAQLELDSAPGKGTQIRIRWPAPKGKETQ